LNERLFERVNHYLPFTYNCAQSSFGALRDVFGFADGGIFKALTPFPGFSRGETCGAVTGCVMALGLLFGSSEEDIKAGKKSTSAAECTREFCDRFEEHHSSLTCRLILTHKLGSANAPENPVEAGAWRAGMERECTWLVHDAVRTVADIIAQRGKGDG